MSLAVMELTNFIIKLFLFLVYSSGSLAQSPLIQLTSSQEPVGTATAANA
jgi:hypothetical protein